MLKSGIFLSVEGIALFSSHTENCKNGIMENCMIVRFFGYFYQVDEPDYAYFCSRNTK